MMGIINKPWLIIVIVSQLASMSRCRNCGIFFFASIIWINSPKYLGELIKVHCYHPFQTASTKPAAKTKTTYQQCSWHGYLDTEINDAMTEVNAVLPDVTSVPPFRYFCPCHGNVIGSRDYQVLNILCWIVLISARRLLILLFR